jgi:hypothetical protein
MRVECGAGPCPGESALVREIEQAISDAAGHHPGIIAEAVVARIIAGYDLLPRETQHRERRRNHEERIRRFSHEVYRILAGAQDLDPGREIAARVSKAFLVTKKTPAGAS